jgi:murein tripeptide amidase MpaA
MTSHIRVRPHVLRSLEWGLLRTSTGVLLLLSIALLLPTSETLAQTKPLDGYQVLRVDIEDQSQLDTLLDLDESSNELEIWSDDLSLGIIEVRVSPAAKTLLDTSGLTYEVYIEDLQRRIDELFAGEAERDFFDSYRTYEEHVTFLENLVAAYPDLAEMHNLGLSVLGMPLWAIRITGPGKEKPGVMYHGGQHGNEIMGSCVVAYMAEYLLTHYHSDPFVKSLVDDVEWFLLPIMNPDGYRAGTRHNTLDVDLNRDWDGPGANPGPFSQPETSSMRDFFLGHPNVRVHIDFHTHGRMIMWPWEHTDELCQDNSTYTLLGTEMAELIIESRGSDYDRRGPVYTTIYEVRGGSLNYTYGVLGLWAITFELGYSHDMPTSEIMPTCIEIAPAMLFLSGWITDCNSNAIPDADDIDTGGVSEDCNENLTPDECEIQPDFDWDGLVDVCDPDIDDDGLGNELDVCDFTPLGAPIDAEGRPIGDTTGDCDIDLVDYGRASNCLTHGGPGIPPYHPACLAFFDFDADGDIDLVDIRWFTDYFTGDR